MKTFFLAVSAALVLGTVAAHAQQDQERKGFANRPAAAQRAQPRAQAQPRVQSQPRFQAQPRVHSAPRMAQPRVQQERRVAVPRRTHTQATARFEQQQRRINREATTHRRMQPRSRVAQPSAPDRNHPGIAGQTPSSGNVTVQRQGRNVQTVRNPVEIRTARQRLSADQSRRLRADLRPPRQHLRHVRFAHRLGSRLPRSVRLYAIPAAVISILPAYSYYRYTYIDDMPYIVDPDTYEVVDVLDQGPAGVYAGGGGSVPELALSADERALVLDSIAPDFPQVAVRVDLALGAELPNAVELHTFPAVVLDRIPRLETFRFVVAGSRVVIVDPREREVVLVINR
jgi:hypothetical protein